MGTLGDGGGDGGASGGPDSKKDDIYENRPGHKKIIRVVTVMAYMVSVSFVAIVLSAYYVFLWQPPNPRLMHRSHLRADPQVEYLVHGPPIESAGDDVPRDGIDDLDRVIVLGEKISVGSQRDESPERSKIPTGAEPRSKGENKIGDDRPISTTAWSPIVRALLATTENPTTVETLADSTGVYESLDAAMKSSLKTASPETSTSEINGSTTRGSSSHSTAMIQSGDKLYGSVNYSTPIVERGNELYDESVNYSTPIDFDGMVVKSGESNGNSNDNSSESAGADFHREFGESMRMRTHESLENSTNFAPKVQTLSTEVEERSVGNFGSSGKSRPAEPQPETLGTIANFGRVFRESMRTRANDSLENSTNITLKVQPILIGMEERSVETVGSSGISRSAELQPKTLGTIANFDRDFGESMRTRVDGSLKNSTNFTLKVQPIPTEVEERSVRNLGSSGKSRSAEPQPETLGTIANFDRDFGESMRTRTNESLENSTNFAPEVQPIPADVEERSVGTFGSSGISRPSEAQPETLGTIANFDRDFGESMRTRRNESLENSTNFTPEVQPIPADVEERSVGTFGSSGISRPSEAQPETLGTIANFDRDFGESMRTRTNESLENSTNFTPEVQPIPTEVEERRVGTFGSSRISRPAEAQPETLGTTAASVQQRGLDWKPLGFTVRSTKLGNANGDELS